MNVKKNPEKYVFITNRVDKFTVNSVSNKVKKALKHSFYNILICSEWIYSFGSKIYVDLNPLLTGRQPRRY